VKIGLTDGKRIEIVSGLEEGDNVLISDYRPATQKSREAPFNRPWGR
jgi:hypothetical protein